MTSELKPCLLCEGEARIFRRSGVRGKVCPSKWYRERVECKVCGLTTREYKKPNAAAHSWNNRPQQKQDASAVPDVPELVRYEPNNKTYPYFKMEEDELGEYVRYDQAAAMIERLQIDASKHAHDAETVRRERDALIVELDQIKAQKPVAWRAPINPYGQKGYTYTGTEAELIRFGHHDRYPLYAAPTLYEGEE